MCFIIHPKHPTAKIAKKDIVCYKVLWHIEKEFRSLAKHYMYKLDKLNDKIVLKTTVQDTMRGIHSIHDGYHSFTCVRAAKGEIRDLISNWSCLIQSVILRNGTYEIHECIIPKGEIYYFNPEHHVYVSTNIIIKEEVK